jgi:hypothetical protein
VPCKKPDVMTIDSTFVMKIVAWRKSALYILAFVVLVYLSPSGSVHAEDARVVSQLIITVMITEYRLAIRPSQDPAAEFFLRARKRARAAATESSLLRRLASAALGCLAASAAARWACVA